MEELTPKKGHSGEPGGSAAAGELPKIMVKEKSTTIDRGGSLTHEPSIQVVAFLGFVLPPGLEVRVPRITSGTPSDHAPWEPSAVPAVGPGQSGRRDRLEGGRGTGLR